MGSVGGTVLLLRRLPVRGHVLAAGSTTPYCPTDAPSYMSHAWPHKHLGLLLLCAV